MENSNKIYARNFRINPTGEKYGSKEEIKKIILKSNPKDFLITFDYFFTGKKTLTPEEFLREFDNLQM